VDCLAPSFGTWPIMRGRCLRCFMRGAGQMHWAARPVSRWHLPPPPRGRGAGVPMAPPPHVAAVPVSRGHPPPGWPRCRCPEGTPPRGRGAGVSGTPPCFIRCSDCGARLMHLAPYHGMARAHVMLGLSHKAHTGRAECISCQKNYHSLTIGGWCLVHIVWHTKAIH
jgi:hypothetical protein